MYTNVRCSPHLVLSNLFGATSDPQLVAVSSGPWYLQEGPSWAPSLAFTSTGFGACQQKFKSLQDLPLPASTCKQSIVVSVPEKASGWTPQLGISFAALGERESTGWGYFFLWCWCFMEWHAAHKKDGIGGIGEWLNTRILSAVPSALSPDPQTPDSHHRILVLSTLTPLELNMSGYEWKAAEKPLLFTVRCYVGDSSWICCPGLGNLAWVLDIMLLREYPLQGRYPSRTWATACGGGANPFAPLPIWLIL